MRWKEALGLVWLVPPLAVAGMWARSFWRLDEVSAVNGENVLRAAVSYRGAVHWVRAENNATERAAGWDVYDVPAGATWGDFYPPGDQDWRVWGVAKHSTRRGPGTPVVTGTIGPIAPRRRMPLAPWLFTLPYRAYAVPYWLVFAATAVPGARAAGRVVVRWSRRRKGLCAGCGYDLRGGGERCPECGEAVGSSGALAGDAGG